MAHARRRATAPIFLGIVVGILASGALIWQTSHAAFTASTENPGNNWKAGSVALSDDDSGAAMFDASGLKPGSTGTRCIKVDYNGDLAASVKLYGTSVSGALGSYLDLQIEEGTGGGSADCAGFAASGTAYSGTLANFGATKTGHASGVGTFAPTASGQSRTYRFTYLLQPTTPDSAQGTSANATFTWTAQTS
ncbi:hypothetical protein ACQEU3_11275 [Spirillospora sp. CA-253888]